ncbi:hydrogenase formation protein HypD [Anaerovorax odorimutans]|uniref:Hydrogenase formation protein HypD n=1 Tax=Anaerovorax odorimutans TaxID=109327 RepID=A0ABT1RT10_9FIRM|nr:hydrogenase formation protein HypD [Anaerovorax odorimutans]
MEIKEVIDYLKAYDGPEIKLMEVCGTHTASIFKNGIRSLISPRIKLISGPGCPVCVTPTAYIDKCIEYAQKENHVLLTFGDMMKVPGTEGSLSDMKGKGAKVELMYSPFEAVEKAQADPGTTYVIAAVGFETTAPAYALMMQQALEKGVKNIRLVTALKTVIPALTWICENQKDIDGFICPGHVSVIIGSKPYEQLAEKYGKPFVVAGFEAEHILAVIYDIVRQLEKKEAKVKNLYTNAVRDEGNAKALAVLETYFKPGPAMWRGLGIIPDSGLYLKDDFYDGGSRGLVKDMELPEGCRCGDVIVGKINPDQCPMFKTQCSPMKPFGPCMVSAEGACGIWYRNK